MGDPITPKKERERDTKHWGGGKSWTIIYKNVWYWSRINKYKIYYQSNGLSRDGNKTFISHLDKHKDSPSFLYEGWMEGGVIDN